MGDGGCGWWRNSNYRVKPNLVYGLIELRLCWGFDNNNDKQSNHNYINSQDSKHDYRQDLYDIIEMGDSHDSHDNNDGHAPIVDMVIVLAMETMVAKKAKRNT